MSFVIDKEFLKKQTTRTLLHALRKCCFNQGQLDQWYAHILVQPTISEEQREGMEKESREKIVTVPPQAFGYSSYTGSHVTIADLKAELATREHVPNKQEAKVLRRKKNQQNRRKGRGDR